MYGGLAVLAAIAYLYLQSRNLLPWSKSKGEAIPQMEVTQMVRAKPKKVDVRVEVNGKEEATFELPTKGLASVGELGERLADEMVSSLNIEDAFKLYYLDGDGDTMLVSAHTALRDLIYSEQLTAKVDDFAPPPPPPPPKSTAAKGEGKEKKKKKSAPPQAAMSFD